MAHARDFKMQDKDVTNAMSDGIYELGLRLSVQAGTVVPYVFDSSLCLM